MCFINIKAKTGLILAFTTQLATAPIKRLNLYWQCCTVAFRYLTNLSHPKSKNRLNATQKSADVMGQARVSLV